MFVIYYAMKNFEMMGFAQNVLPMMTVRMDLYVRQRTRAQVGQPQQLSDSFAPAQVGKFYCHVITHESKYLGPPGHCSFKNDS